LSQKFHPPTHKFSVKSPPGVVAEHCQHLHGRKAEGKNTPADFNDDGLAEGGGLGGYVGRGDQPVFEIDTLF
jgi:hypothetical protein